MYNLKRYKNKEKNPPKEILKKKYEAKKQTNVKLTNNNKKTIIFINLNSLKNIISLKIIAHYKCTYYILDNFTKYY